MVYDIIIILKYIKKPKEIWISRKTLCVERHCLRPATLLKKKTLAQVFSCKFCESSKNTFFYRTPLVAASVFSTKHLIQVDASNFVYGLTWDLQLY